MTPKYSILLLSLLLLQSCASPNPAIRSPQIHKGVQIKAMNSEGFPFSVDEQAVVGKLTRSGAFAASAGFVSDSGLLLTTYASVAGQLAKMSSPKELIFEQGYVAANREQEYRLPEHRLLLQTEQRDVTEILRKDITEQNRNAEIFRKIEQAKSRLIEDIKRDNPEAIVEIRDLYAGNRQVLSVYKVLTDLRLVFAPPAKIHSANLADGSKLTNALLNEFVLLRAYNNDGTPYTTDQFFRLSSEIPQPSDVLYAFGFPTSTYRLNTERTTSFYHNNTNPYILDAYRIYLDKEDKLSSLNAEYALNTLSNRISIEDNIRYFSAIQNAIQEDSILAKKAEREHDFTSWIHEDSVRADQYEGVFYSIDRAIRIAEQTGDIFFVLSYFNSLSTLDDLAAQFRAYRMEAGKMPSPTQLSALSSQVLTNQQRILQNTNIEAELSVFRDFLLLIRSVPEQQQPLQVFDLFSGSSVGEQRLATRFAQQTRSSFLFDPEKAAAALQNGQWENDSLFIILDELAMTHEFARNNYRQHFPYLIPAQQIFTRGLLEWNPDISPDAVEVLSFNMGHLNTVSDNILDISIDFSARAQGSFVLTENRSVAGMITPELTEAVSANYVFDPERAILKARSSKSILQALSGVNAASHLLEELTESANR